MNGYRDPRLAAEFRWVVGPDNHLEFLHLEQQEILDALSDLGALLALRWRLCIPLDADLLEVIDALCILSGEERDWAESLCCRVGARLLARTAPQ